MYVTFYDIEIQTDRERAKEYAREFAEMQTRNNAPAPQRLSEVIENPAVDYEVGDMVVVTNGYDVKLLKKVLGFCEPTSYGGCVYLDWDCYWCPANPENLQHYDENYIFE